MNIHGYTTMMCPEGMKLPYLETLLSWSRICKTISICYSRFPSLDLEVPEGAVKPWVDDGSIEILKRFDKEVLGNKLIFIEHEWDINEPLEDGKTKQIARESALSQCGDDKLAWVIHFDADEILRDDDDLRILEAIETDNKNEFPKQKPFLMTGILEFFGSNQQVRFGFGTWTKIRATRNIREIRHGLPLRMGAFPVRGRNPITNKVISLNNIDDGSGFISELSYTRPDYNMGIWLFDPMFINLMGQINNINESHKSYAYRQVGLALEKDIDAGGVYLYHAGWIDIPRKWSMGWFWDNAWGLLAGKQNTFTEKAESNGYFTQTFTPSGEELGNKLKQELDRVEIYKLNQEIAIPNVYEIVSNWRNSI